MVRLKFVLHAVKKVAAGSQSGFKKLRIDIDLQKFV
jgi:hypothetical protein